jgi:hypothetical protein
MQACATLCDDPTRGLKPFSFMLTRSYMRRAPDARRCHGKAARHSARTGVNPAKSALYQAIMLLCPGAPAPCAAFDHRDTKKKEF